MTTSLHELAIDRKNKQIDVQENDPAYYLDLQDSSLEIQISAKDKIANKGARKSGDQVSPFCQGAILKARFKLRFKNAPPPESSIVIFSPHSTNKPFDPQPMPPNLWEKVWWYLSLKWLQPKTIEEQLGLAYASPMKELGEDGKPEADEKPEYVNVALGEGERLHGMHGGKKLITESGDKPLYRYIAIDEAFNSYDLEMNLDSQGFNLAKHTSEAIWISIKRPDGFCQPYALHLPGKVLNNIVYLIPKPLSLTLDLKEHKGEPEFSRTIEFFRNDKQKVEISVDGAANKNRFIKLNLLRDNAVKLTVDLQALRSPKAFDAPKLISYLQFHDKKSKGKLRTVFPVMVTK